MVDGGPHFGAKIVNSQFLFFPSLNKPPEETSNGFRDLLPHHAEHPKMAVHMLLYNITILHQLQTQDFPQVASFSQSCKENMSSESSFSRPINFSN